MPVDATGGLKIDVIGLRDLQRELRKLDKTLPKELRQAGLKAAKVVVDDTVSSFESRGGVNVRVARNIKAKAQQREASVTIGPTSVRRGPSVLLMGAEFGASVHRQFDPWRGKGEDAGYSLFPSIKKNRARIIEIYGDLVSEVSRDAFPD